jgi:hypothetical protein
LDALNAVMNHFVLGVYQAMHYQILQANAYSALQTVILVIKI